MRSSEHNQPTESQFDAPPESEQGMTPPQVVRKRARAQDSELRHIDDYLDVFFSDIGTASDWFGLCSVYEDTKPLDEIARISVHDLFDFSRVSHAKLRCMAALAPEIQEYIARHLPCPAFFEQYKNTCWWCAGTPQSNSRGELIVCSSDSLWPLFTPGRVYCCLQCLLRYQYCLQDSYYFSCEHAACEDVKIRVATVSGAFGDKRVYDVVKLCPHQLPGIDMDYARVYLSRTFCEQGPSKRGNTA